MSYEKNKFLKSLLDESSEYMRFQLEYHVIPSAIHKNSSRNLMIYFVAIRKYDILLNSAAVSLLYETLPPSIKTPHYFYYKTPEASISTTYFISIFQWTLWMAILIIIILAIILIAAFNIRIKNSIEKFLQIIFDIFGISSEINIMHNLSMLYIKYSVQIMMFLISSVFSSFLISELCTIHPELPFTNLDELINQNEYSLCMYTTQFAYEYMIGLEKVNLILNRDNCNDMVKYIQKPQEQICGRTDWVFFKSEKQLNNKLHDNIDQEQ